MAKTKKPKPTSTHRLLVGTSILLAALSSALLLYIVKDSKPELASEQPLIRMTSNHYNIENGKLVERSDNATAEQKTFLENEVAKSGCEPPNYKPARFTVIAESNDRSQLLLGYGCGSTDAQMYAVKKDGKWQTISPTNQFNQFDIPLCSHVDSSGISREIAPVCVDSRETLTPVYSVR